jgi:hypothetical protein
VVGYQNAPWIRSDYLSVPKIPFWGRIVAFWMTIRVAGHSKRVWSICIVKSHTVKNPTSGFARTVAYAWYWITGLSVEDELVLRGDNINPYKVHWKHDLMKFILVSSSLACFNVVKGIEFTLFLTE